MNGLLAVYQKELALYFRSPIAYFVVSVFLIGTGYFFSHNVFLTNIATMDSTFQSMGIMLTIVCPVISMRLFSGEYSSRTMELLLTLPLKNWQTVLGKFMGAGTILLLMTIGTFIDLLPMYLFAEPETTTIISGYIGFFLLGLACLAVGQFFSVLTKNQIVAALLTVSALLAFWFIGNLQNFQSTYFWWRLFEYLSFSNHFSHFIQGLVRIEGIIFYVLICATFLTMNASYLQWRR